MAHETLENLHSSWDALWEVRPPSPHLPLLHRRSIPMVLGTGNHTPGASTSAFRAGSSLRSHFRPGSHGVVLKGSGETATCPASGHYAVAPGAPSMSTHRPVWRGRPGGDWAPWGGFLARLRVGPPPLSAPVGPCRSGCRLRAAQRGLPDGRGLLRRPEPL